MRFSLDGTVEKTHHLMPLERGVQRGNLKQAFSKWKT